MKKDDFLAVEDRRRWRGGLEPWEPVGTGVACCGEGSLSTLTQAQLRVGALAPTGPTHRTREAVGAGGLPPFLRTWEKDLLAQEGMSSPGNPRCQVFLQTETTVPTPRPP